MGLALLIVAMLAAAYAAILVRVYWRRREYPKAVQTLKLLLLGMAAYLAILIGVSVASADKVVGGEEVKLCDVTMDCSRSAFVVGVDRRKTLGDPPREMIADGIYYLVTVKVTSYEANPDLDPRDLMTSVVDAEGRKYRRFPEGERALMPKLNAENPFELQIGPTGGSYKRTFVFDLPMNVNTPTLVVQRGSWIDRIVELFLIGDEDSLFHGKTRLLLEIPKPSV